MNPKGRNKFYPEIHKQKPPLIYFLGLVFFSVFLWSLLLEGASAFFVPPWPARELRPTLYLQRHAEEFGKRFNSWGLIDDERALKKPLGKKRILFIGDSFLENPFLSTTLSAEVCENLKTKSPSEFECINLGVSATGPAQYLYRLKNIGLRLQPDIVLLFLFEGNDYVDRELRAFPWPLIAERPLPSLLGFGLPRSTWLLVHRLRLSEFGRGSKQLPDEFRWLKAIANMPYERGVAELSEHMKKNYFPQMQTSDIESILRRGGPLFWQELSVRNQDQEFLQAWQIRLVLKRALEKPYEYQVSKAAKATGSYLEAVRDILQKANVPLAVFFIPMAENVDLAYREFWAPWYEGKTEPSLSEITEFLKVKLAQEETPAINLTDVLKGIPDTYRKFDGHWNEKGQQIAAGKIVKYLEQAGVN